MQVIPKTYTKQELIAKLKEISAMGFVPNTRQGNHGGIGNTLEDLLGIQEKQFAYAECSRMGVEKRNVPTPLPSPLFFILNLRHVQLDLCREFFYRDMVGRTKRAVINIRQVN